MSRGSGCFSQSERVTWRGWIPVPKNVVDREAHMSLEASTYTPDTTPIPRDEFVRAAMNAGWVVRPVHDIFQPDRFHSVSGGVVTDGDYFYGWRFNDPQSNDYERALAARKVEQLEAWAQEDQDLGAAFIHVQPYQHVLSREQEAELAAETSSEYVAALRAAKREYLVDLHANNDDFRMDLARLISRLRGGLWVDHLAGEWGVDVASRR
jgi:hypothetical protein